MSSIMNVSSMTGYAMQVAQIKASSGSKNQSDEVSFSEVVTKEAGAGSATTKTAGVKTLDPKEMTMEEYKSYVHHRIDQMVQNRHPSQAFCSYAINISEEGFEAMKNDPEYENWVFNEALKKNLDFNDPWTALTGGSYHILNIGPTKETSNGQGWGVNYQKGHGGDIFDAQTGNSFYKNRVDTSAAEKKAKDYWAERDRKKQMRLQEELDELWFKRKESQRRIQEAWLEQQAVMDGIRNLPMGSLQGDGNMFDAAAIHMASSPSAFLMMPGLF